MGPFAGKLTLENDQTGYVSPFPAEYRTHEVIDVIVKVVVNWAVVKPDLLPDLERWRMYQYKGLLCKDTPEPENIQYPSIGMNVFPVLIQP